MRPNCTPGYRRSRSLFDEGARCILHFMFKCACHPGDFIARNSNFGGLRAPTSERGCGFNRNGFQFPGSFFGNASVTAGKGKLLKQFRVFSVSNSPG
jgi:hypothetical protein